VDIEGREESTNVEDRRGEDSGGGGAGGFGGFGGFGRTGLAAGGAGGIIILILGLIFGFDVTKFFNPGGPPGNPGGPPQGNPGVPRQRDDDGPPRQHRPADPEEEKMAHFVKVIFHDTEVVWGDLFRKMGRTYQEPILVLFSGHVQSACGTADAAVGPFYCPGDSRVYIDLSFYHDMERKLNAPGEFARAYVIAHEVGHHVQRLLGYSKQVDEARRTMSKADYNKMSVRLELQADYLAGVWAHHGQEKFNFLQKGDIESALNAAFQIGDDRLQKQARGYVVPDSFTHGTSKQRQYWFKKGFDTGDVKGAAALFELKYEDL
jgi:predicted metalloprotease